MSEAKKLDIIDTFLDDFVKGQVSYLVDQQEILVNLMSAEEDLSDDAFTELTNNNNLLGEMKTEDFNTQITKIYKDAFLELTILELKSISASITLRKAIDKVNTKASKEMDNLINSYDFLVEVSQEDA